MKINKDNTTVGAEVAHGEISIEYSDVVTCNEVSIPVEYWQQIKEYVDSKIVNSMDVESKFLGGKSGNK